MVLCTLPIKTTTPRVAILCEKIDSLTCDHNVHQIGGNEENLPDSVRFINSSTTLQINVFFLSLTS